MKLSTVLFVSCCLIQFSNGFFTGDVSKLVNKTTSRFNLTCYYYGEVATNNEYCSYQSFSNGSLSISMYDYTPIASVYRSMSQRCTGFSSTTDIGYGTCSPLPFELFNQSILCVCATNMCNVNLTTCQASVDNHFRTNTAPAVLQSIIPQLTKPISCADPDYPSNATSFCMELASPFIDLDKCNAYARNNTVLCIVQSFEGEEHSFAVTRDYFMYFLTAALDRVLQLQRDPSKAWQYNETTAALYINYSLAWLTENGTSATGFLQRCYCAEDDCNRSLKSCLTAVRTNSAAGELGG